VLDLAGQGLPFAELRQRVIDAGADVRLVILDSCRSGALLALKGGTLGQPFDIRLADDLASTGEAMIASSAADEAALESSKIGASFFSHHLQTPCKASPVGSSSNASRLDGIAIFPTPSS
jgi:hypothetical protein